MTVERASFGMTCDWTEKYKPIYFLGTEVQNNPAVEGSALRIVIIIIIIIIISFMQRIYTYVPEKSYVPREYSVAAILLLLQCMSEWSWTSIKSYIDKYYG